MPYIDRLRALKEERGYTNAEIAQLSGISVGTVTRMFNGTTEEPLFSNYAKVVIALGGSLDEIIGLKQAEAPPVDAHIGNTLVSYAELIKEKDERLKEKDSMIEMLKERCQQDRTERKRILWFCGIFVALILTILLVDVLNGNFGYFRY